MPGMTTETMLLSRELQRDPLIYEVIHSYKLRHRATLGIKFLFGATGGYAPATRMHQ